MNRGLHFAAAWLALLLAGGTLSANAQALATPAPPVAAIEQHLGAQLPLETQAVDDFGRPVHLGDYFHDGRPVLLVLGYYRCPQLCGLLMHGLLGALHESQLPRDKWRIVRVSIDPQDDVASARERRNLDLAYADFLLGAETADAPLELHLLTVPGDGLGQLARRAGFSYSPAAPAAADEPAAAAAARFAHPASVIVVTPQGRISSYLMGIDFDAADLSVALADAAGDRTGSITSRIALLCAHFDPKVGRHDSLVMNTIRGVALALMAGLAGWCWRRRHPQGGALK